MRAAPAYYEPLLLSIDREFRRLDSQMRLRLEQRERERDRLPTPSWKLLVATARVRRRSRNGWIPPMYAGY